MSLSFFAPNRTVLLISDESLYIYASGAKGVDMIEAVPWDIEGFLPTVKSIITRECGRRPILILNDMVEQHYRKEKIIKAGVGSLDKANIVKRKLNVAFPSYPVRAAYLLKEKIKKTPSQAAADIYIFAAVPGTTQFKQTIEVSKQSLSSLAGFCLLPVESSNMVKLLCSKVSKLKNKNAMWSIMIGQHRNGSLRQIVTKNGELALTRMTPVIDTDKDPRVWAEQVNREFNATMSYLSRFGYSPDDTLDAVAIANVEAGDILQSMFQDKLNFHTMTASEAAKLLNLSIGSQEDQRYADTLHVAWSGKKSRFILPMKATQVDEVSKPRQIAMAASIAMLASGVFLGYQFLNEYQKLTETMGDIESGQKRQAQLEVQYQREIKRKEELGFNVRLVQGAIKVHEEFESKKINLIGLFEGVGKALGRDFRIDSISVQRFQNTLTNAILNNSFSGQPNANKGTPNFESVIQMTYPSTTDVVKGNQEVENLKTKITQILPDHDVRVTKLLKDYGFEEGIVVEAGDLAKEDVTQDFVAEITIKGPPVEQGGVNK